jgi:sugar diacid utilization regulator
VTSAASDGYGEETQLARVKQSNLTHQFFAALTSADPPMPLATKLAETLGYQPDGTFQALCMPAQDWPEDRIDRLRRALAQLPGHQLCATAGAVTLLLGQGHDFDVDTVLHTISQVQADASPVGIGLRRSGVDGAVDSVDDAVRALALARPGAMTVWFADEWLTISLEPQSAKLVPLFAPAVRTAEAHTHLAEAVVAFADHGLSVAAAARAMHLHPNSLAYRLTRWRELTGWDPRSGDGLVASLVALRLHARSESFGQAPPTGA